jgi:hypothetical protein
MGHKNRFIKNDWEEGLAMVGYEDTSLHFVLFSPQQVNRNPSREQASR